MDINVTYDPRTALIVVDVQNDFADPAGSLYVQGGEHVVPLINAEVARARAAGSSVGGIWPVHCVMDTWGAEFHPDLLVDGPEVRKGSNGEDGYSGFSMRDPETHEVIATELEDLLRRRHISRLVIAGPKRTVQMRNTHGEKNDLSGNRYFRFDGDGTAVNIKSDCQGGPNNKLQR